MSTEFETNREAQVRAHIAATRAELGETLEALAAETRVKARAEHVTRDTVSGLKIGLMSFPLRAASSLAALWRRGSTNYGKMPPTQRRLSTAAVASGAVTALLAVTRPWNALRKHRKGCRR